jgi:hypothetical protein
MIGTFATLFINVNHSACRTEAIGDAKSSQRVGAGGPMTKRHEALQHPTILPLHRLR